METIFLTGPKHSGKTSVGKALAFLCSCDFVDLDDVVKQQTGKTPRELYTEDMAIFRKAEAQALKSIIGSHKTPESRLVVAVRSGTIENPDALSIFENNSFMVYLDISAENAWDRIASLPENEFPPLLKTDNPEETHRTLHEKRAAAYWEMATIIIDTEDKTPEEIAGEILSKIIYGTESLF